MHAPLCFAGSPGTPLTPGSSRAEHSLGLSHLIRSLVFLTLLLDSAYGAFISGYIVMLDISFYFFFSGNTQQECCLFIK